MNASVCDGNRSIRMCLISPTEPVLYDVFVKTEKEGEQSEGKRGLRESNNSEMNVSNEVRMNTSK